MSPEGVTPVAGAARRSSLPAAARKPRVRGRVRSTRWPVVVTAVLGALALAVYAWAALRGMGGPRSWYGKGFGIAATVALAAVMTYSGRRAVPSVRALGRVQPYLRLHVHAGLLFLLLFLLHTDAGLPRGVLNTTLWLVTVWVVLTGVVGTLLQRWIPQVLDDATALEVHLARIPELVEELRTRAEKEARAGGPRVEAFYEREVAPEMAGPRPAFRLRPGRTVGQTFLSSEMDVLRRTLGEERAGTLDELEELYRTKADLDLHYTLQRILRGWLYLHLPAGIVMIGLVLLHVFFVLYF